MPKLTLCVWFVLIQLAARSQIRVVQDENGTMTTEVTNLNTPNILRYKGSVFLKDSAELGTFSVSGGKKLVKSVLFDVLHQAFLADFDTRIVPLKNTDLQLGSLTLKNINGAYYETRHKATVKLLCRYSCSLKDYSRDFKNGTLQAAESGYTGEVVHKKEYFLLFPDNSLRAINLSRYSVSLALIKEYDGIKYHIDQWGREIKTETDVSELLTYLNTEGVL